MGAEFTTGVLRILGDAPDYWEKKKQEREKFKLEKEKRETELKNLGLNQKILERNLESLPDQELKRITQETILQQQQLDAKLKMMENDLGKQVLWKTFDAVDIDNNWERMNKAIQTNPYLAPAYGEIARLEPFNPDTDAKFMLENGLDPEAFKQNPNLNKIFVKGINKDGEVEPVDVRAWKLRTGYYTEYLAKNKMTEELAKYKSEIEKAQKSVLSLQLKRIREELRLAKTGKEPKSPEERRFEFYQELEKNPEKANIWKKYESLKNSKGKEANILESSEEKLKKITGVNNLEEVSFEDKETRNKARRTIVSIQKIWPQKLSSEDIKFLTKTAGMIEMGKKVGENLTESDTGLVDDFLKSVGVYISNDIKGAEARAAYQTFSNSLIHSLYGAVLQANEEKRYNKMFGNLGMQAGPVAAKFKVALEKVKAELEQRLKMQHPAVAAYYAGTSVKKLEDALNALNERIKFFSRFESEKGQQNYVKERAKELKRGRNRRSANKQTENTRNELDNIFMENKNKEEISNNSTNELDAIFGS